MRDRKVKERLLSSHNTGTTVKWKVGVFAPGAALTKIHEPAGLKQQKCIRLLLWRPEVQNQCVSWQSWFFLETQERI